MVAASKPANSTDSTMFDLACTACDWQSADVDLSACPICGATIDICYDSPQIPVQADLPGIWRYAARLPLRDLAHAVSLGEGGTPLLRSARVGAELGLPELRFKIEGANPTGSYKDRIAAVGIARLRELGKRAWAATSSGNAGAAVAAYGVRAGLDGYLFTLEKAARAKIAQILAYGPRVFAVERLGYDPAVEQATWRNIRAICDANGWGMLVTARRFSPHAMEGVKTIAYEICEQLGGPPDVVYVPVGGGGLLSATWKGFVEWHAAGRADRLPRIVAVQPQGCDGITQAWRAGRAVEPIDGCTSAISGLQLTAPPDGDLVLRALREAGGWAVSVPDDATYAAQAELAAREGIFAEPAAAITLAGVRADMAAGRLHGGERAVCLLTGIGFKDANAVQRMVEDREVRAITAEDILNIAG
jgi:threonine synthase